MPLSIPNRSKFVYLFPVLHQSLCTSAISSVSPIHHSWNFIAFLCAVIMVRKMFWPLFWNYRAHGTSLVLSSLLLAVSELDYLFLMLYVLAVHCWPGFLPLWLLLLLLWWLQLLLALGPVSCFVQTPLFPASNETALCESAWFISSRLLYVRLLSFYFWHHIMLHWRMVTLLVPSNYVLFSICLVWCIHLTMHAKYVFICNYNMYKWHE